MFTPVPSASLLLASKFRDGHFETPWLLWGSPARPNFTLELCHMDELAQHQESRRTMSMTGNLEMAKPVPLLGRGGAGLRGKYKVWY
jgi:hypothetical protein